MPRPINRFDAQTIANLRAQYGAAIASYSDSAIIDTWRELSQSDEWDRRNEVFIEWLLDCEPQAD